MKVFIFCTFFSSLLCYAAPKLDARTEIANLDHEWAQAYVKKDFATLERIMSDDLVSTDSTGTAYLKGKHQDLAALKAGTLIYESFNIEKVDVKVHGDTAVAVGRFTMTGKSEGKPFSGRYAYTEAWVKRQGRWQAIAEHISTIQ